MQRKKGRQKIGKNVSSKMNGTEKRNKKAVKDSTLGVKNIFIRGGGGGGADGGGSAVGCTEGGGAEGKMAKFARVGIEKTKRINKITQLEPVKRKQ